MEKNNEFVLEIPSFLNPESIPESTEDSNIANLKKAIKAQYEEIICFQDEQINDKNKKILKV